MRITKTQLMQIIKEELSEAVVGMSASRGVPPKTVLDRAETAYGKIDELLEELMGEAKYYEAGSAGDDMNDIYNAIRQLRAYIDNQEASMNEAAKPIEDLIKKALKNAELPEDIKLKAFYHAKPSDKVFLVPAEDKYNGNAEMYRPTRAPGGRLVFPENTPLLISIEAGKVGMPIEDLVNALKGMGLASIGKDAYTGRAY
jgi:hypothetical protein